MGRRPELAETLALRGTARADRDHTVTVVGEKLTSVAQCNVTGLQIAPDRAKRLFRRTCEQLIKLKVLEESYLPTVLLYAMEYEKYLQASEECKKGRYITKRDEMGEISGFIENPSFKRADKALMNVKSLAAELGVTPISRQRLRLGEQVDQSTNIKNLIIAATSIYTEQNGIDEQNETEMQG